MQPPIKPGGDQPMMHRSMWRDPSSMWRDPTARDADSPEDPVPIRTPRRKAASPRSGIWLEIALPLLAVVAIIALATLL
jgi:hypothetical protein